MAKKVTTIPATLGKFDSKPITTANKRRVAAYARVSTDTEEQATSYDAQVDYYTKYIKGRTDWEFVGIYTDEGITATNTKNRDGFKQMVEDALAGKIDLIITKSVSRFARNTVDSLTTVRELKEKGVEIYFEKENIWTLDSKGELLITIMSSLAQEESRSISENTTWGRRKLFADGKASIAFSRFLGYDRGPNGEFVINEEEAKTVRYIYKRYIEGAAIYAITKELMEMERPTPCGGKKWHISVVKNILRNEKYKGDALLQKSFTKDFLAHKLVPNNGEVPQYYVEGHHEGIVSPEVFELAQMEIKRRTSKEGCSFSSRTRYASKIVCGQCGSWYGSKIWHSNDKYRKVVYYCNHKYNGDTKCTTPHINECDIEKLFVRAVNELLSNKKEILQNTKGMLKMVCSTDKLEKESADLVVELNTLAEQMQKAIAENSTKALDQTEYDRVFSSMQSCYDATKEKYDAIQQEISDQKVKRSKITEFIRMLKETNGYVSAYDESVWANLIDKVTAVDKEHIIFTFKNGQEITVPLKF